MSLFIKLLLSYYILCAERYSFLWFTFVHCGHIVQFVHIVHFVHIIHIDHSYGERSGAPQRLQRSARLLHVRKDLSRRCFGSLLGMFLHIYKITPNPD